MIANSKLKKIFLISLGFIFTFSVIVDNSLNSKNSYCNLNPENSISNLNLKISKISGSIHIDNNWSDAKAARICTGLGNESDPYIIENLEIDVGGSGSSILIENSDESFNIVICTLSNTGDEYYDAGIKLNSLENGQLVNNTGSSDAFGVYLNRSDGNLIIKNTFTNKRGLYMGVSYDNIIYLNNFIATQVNTFILLNIKNANRWSSLKKANYIYKGNKFTNYLGNYYALYTNVDNNNDGIGDTPYIKYGPTDLYVDYYPLIERTENYEIIKFLKSSGDIIPGYNMFILIGALSIGAVLISKKVIKN